MSSFVPDDIVTREIRQLLEALDAGVAPRNVETPHADVKEEPGRRGPGGVILAGAARSEAAARYLHGELACMANTPGGGGLVVGVADDGQRIGTELDADELRHRVYQLANGQLTPDVQPHRLSDGTRVLVCRVPEAVEPHRVNARIRWRVDDSCVEVDAATWHARLTRATHDWSAEGTDVDVADADKRALDAARRFLRAAGTQEDAELADAHDLALLRQLPNVIDAADRLTNAGRLLFTDVRPALDYRHRAATGGDADQQVRRSGPVLVQLAEVFGVLASHGRTTHIDVPGEPVIGQYQTLPQRSAREAIVNGVVHRDWFDPEPTEVEHVADRLRVTSPGGLVGTVTPENIITHVSTPRHRALAELTTRLRLTERQGIGVDRMYVDLLRIGRPKPEIVELDGPMVRTTLLGGAPDLAWVQLLSRLEPARLRRDLNVLLALDLLSQHGWGEAQTLAVAIQDSVTVAAATLAELGTTTVDGRPVVAEVGGQPVRESPAWTLTTVTRSLLGRRAAWMSSVERRPGLLLGYAERFGRISTTEASSLAGVAPQLVGEVLKDLEADGALEPSRENRSGRGFHYRLPTS